MSDIKVCKVYLSQNGSTVTVFVSDDLIRSCFLLCLFLKILLNIVLFMLSRLFQRVFLKMFWSWRNSYGKVFASFS